VLFEAPIATGLIASFVSAVSGGHLYRKSSFLLDSLGSKVFPDFFQLQERPFLPRACLPRPSIPKAWRPGTGTWSRTAWWRAISWGATAPASWG
jgi:hypothetical protein